MNIWINKSYNLVNGQSYPSFCTMTSKSFKHANNPHKLDIQHMLNHFSDSQGALQASSSGAYITSLKISGFGAFLKGQW